ncbi:hypothetical protein GE061_019785 [Apolygus lucorum]|uniref:Uncharacterized protein n=1 Tax=Apolygus lucorum TaxID=248454 RepID=A0A6A4JQ60_APOLU|nr:hypothetical protein GE061_019785 [Apolygus lucorum]
MWKKTLFLACAVALVCPTLGTYDNSTCQYVNQTQCSRDVLATMKLLLEQIDNCFPNTSYCCCSNESCPGCQAST